MSDDGPLLKAITKIADRADDLQVMLEKGGFTPPEAVQSNARRGLELRRKYGRGGLTNSEASQQGIGSGVQRASNLANGKSLSLDTIRRMHAFFERHEKNKDTPPDEGNGKIAWLLWGGDAARRWAAGILRQEGILKRLDALNRRLDAIAKEGEGSGPTADAVHVPSTEWGDRPKKKPKPAKAEAQN